MGGLGRLENPFQEQEGTRKEHVFGEQIIHGYAIYEVVSSRKE